MMKEDAIVEIEFLLKRDDGSVCGVGRSGEVSRGEAAKLIEAKEAKALTHPVGVIPPEWDLRVKKTDAVEE